MHLKVGLFSDSFMPSMDGVANAVLNYAEIINRDYGTSVVATPKYPKFADNFSFKVVRYPSIPMDKKIGYRAGNPLGLKAIDELRSDRLDILHVHSPFTSGLLAKFVAHDQKMPVVLTYHTKYDIDIAERFNLRVMQKLVKDFILSVIGISDEVWAVSDGAGKNLQSLGYKGNYMVMENGSSFPKGKVEKSRIEALKQQHGVQDDEFVFLFVGRMMWYKNIRLTIDALRAVRNKGLPFKMLFVGDGYDRAEIEAYVAEQKLEDCCIFTGRVLDRELLRCYFSMADLFMFPSTYDTNGLVVREAAASECPSLLITGSCAAEGVQDQFSGFLAEEHAESCADRLLKAVESKEQLRQIGIQAAEHVYISWDDAVKKAYARYEHLVRNY